MSGLVDYSSSDEESDEKGRDYPDLDEEADEKGRQPALPPLPATFRDLYSSTVRTSTQDDPSLHAGRKRATPHVVGNWPTHVYLEWWPGQAEHWHHLLSAVVKEVRDSFNKPGEQVTSFVHSLLRNDLGVQLPLHVSLSRPLSLPTEQKDAFPLHLKDSIAHTAVRAFAVKPLDLVWHSNEDGTRWFLVLRLRRPAADELRRLLRACNDLAAEYRQPLLYADDGNAQPEQMEEDPHDSFHISIAWSLRPNAGEKSNHVGALQQAMSNDLRKRLACLSISFIEVKVRVGQDVSSILLPRQRVTQQEAER